MTKTAAVSEIIATAPDLPKIFSTGFISRIAASVADPPHHFYMTGSMGLALPLGTGVALATGRTTVVVDGDGSLLMNPAGLLAAGAAKTLPLIHIVLDDGRYDSTGGQPTPGDSADLTAWARACGFSRARSVADRGELSKVLKAAVTGCSAPVFLHCTVEPDAAPPPRVTENLAGITDSFSAALRTVQ
ncbi:thiamine pyrophosphate-dependent enzyme [Streptomyces inhibens]|uniref:thiamine pyrophosphate-dependent enzyme n=1 Tax=Streptomyces inhibens TaxID=2293571 RepID=UPI001EE76EA6|nr:thiamine pyrophosphate-dependent enzyme [Streptomyces inhibens]UKY54139.1 thiamine pyrophosphate-dependent enzyme [Streptomyces inhibens]